MQAYYRGMGEETFENHIKPTILITLWMDMTMAGVCAELHRYDLLGSWEESREGSTGIVPIFQMSRVQRADFTKVTW